MRLPHFFIDRPIFAAVLSIIILIIGAIAQRTLPIAEYPEIAPPTVNIAASYPGASAQIISETVATPIEQEVNGVDDMLYIVSQSTGDGRLSINVVFKPGTNIDQAQVLVQNRVSVAEPRLPEDVRRLGIAVRKASPDLMMVVHMTSPDGSRDQQYISNYATLYVKDVLLRLDGVGNINIFGARDYSMRVWLDPAKVANVGLTASEVVASLQAANLQVAAGSINQPPATSPGAFELSVQTLGRLDLARPVRGHRRQGWRGWIRRARARHCARRARLAGLHGQRLPQQQDRHRARHLPAAGLQRAGDRKGHPHRDGSTRQGLSARRRLFRCLQSDGLHPVVRRCRRADAARSGAARGRRRHPLPADMARGDHPDRRHSGFADWHLRGHGRGRDFVQHPVAIWARAGHRHRRRRRDCRRGERRTLSAPGHVSTRGCAQDYGRGRQRPGGHLAGAHSGVPPHRLHRRPAGLVLSAVRHHHCRFDGDLRARVADALTRARRASIEAARRARRRKERCSVHAYGANSLVLCRLQLGVRALGARVRRHDRPLRAARGDVLDHLRRPARPHLLAAGHHADGAHSAARPHLFHYRLPAAAGLHTQPHRRGRAQGGRYSAHPPGRRSGRGICRLRRRDLHQRTQYGRHLRPSEVVRGARASGIDQGRHPRGSASAVG